MKLFDTQSFAEALAGAWSSPSQRKARLESYREPPSELRTLAERYRASSDLSFSREPQETLEQAET